MKSILIRCDASVAIGSGHVVRCRTLARELKRHGADLIFLCRQQHGDLIELLEEEFRVLVLPMQKLSNCTNLAGRELYQAWLGCSQENDAADCLETLNQAGISKVNWLIVDHYGLDITWEKQLLNELQRNQSKPKLLAIDDLADRNHMADLLLDQNFFGTNTDERYRSIVPEDCRQLIGPHYALLGPEYAKLHPLVPNRTKLRRVLIFFGGVDPDNLTCQTIKALMDPALAHLAVDVVIGRQSSHRQLVIDLVNERPNTTLHESLPSLAELITKADLGIGAGGATTWERACLSLPSLVIAIADNQLSMAKALEQSNHLRLIGNGVETSMTEIRSTLLEIISKPYEEGDAGRSLTDGWGASRIAMCMLGAPQEIQLRNAEKTDEALLLRWANESNVRESSFSPDSIEPEIHKKWFQKILVDTNRLLLIATEANGCPIGQIRFDLISADNKDDLDEAKIDLSLDRCIRGQGLASEIIRLGIEAMTKHWGLRVKAIAEVLKSNIASNACFARANFIREEVSGGDNLIGFTNAVHRWAWYPEMSQNKPIKQEINNNTKQSKT